MTNYSKVKLEFSVLESTKVKKENIKLEHELDDARILKININNSFHVDKSIPAPRISLFPKKHQNYLELIIATAAINTKECVQIREVALRNLPVYCRISIDDKVDAMAGVFFVVNYSVDINGMDVPEISFRLHSTGTYCYDADDEKMFQQNISVE